MKMLLFMCYAYSAVYLYFMFWRDSILDDFTLEDIQNRVDKGNYDVIVSAKTAMFIMFICPIVNTVMLFALFHSDIKLLIKQWRHII